MSAGLTRTQIITPGGYGRIFGSLNPCSRIYAGTNNGPNRGFPSAAAPLTVKTFTGSSGGGGGNNPLVFSPAINYTPAIGDLLVFLASYGGSVNQISQPGLALPAQPIGLTFNDGGVNVYTRIAYNEAYNSYLGGGNNVVVNGIWAAIATNTNLIGTVNTATNLLHDVNNNTGYVSQSDFSVFFYAFTPGRMPKLLYNFNKLTRAIALQPFKSNAGRFSIMGSRHSNGTLTTSLTYRNDHVEEHNSVAKETVSPTDLANVGTDFTWCGSVIMI